MHNKTMNYNFLKKQLIRLFNSKQALPGLEKYDADTLAPLPFDGASVIHMTPEPELIQIKEQIQNKFKTIEIADKVALVSSNSFHITTFDLMNRFDHEQKLIENKYKYEEVFTQITEETKAFINSGNVSIDSEIEILGVGVYGSIIIFKPVMKPTLMDTFIRFRKELHQYLTEKIKGYSFAREANWQAKFSPHITLGYIVKPMNQSEIDDFINLIKNINQNFPAVKLKISEGDCTFFSDMDSYKL